MQTEKPTNPILQGNRFPGLNLSEDLIQPWYEQGSLLNLPASIAAQLGSNRMPHPPLKIEFLERDLGVNQVVLILLDGLSFDRFNAWIPQHEVNSRISMDGFLHPVTSIVPSTTCSVLTTLWTGRSPAEHAILGYELFLKEYGIVSNMITHSPIKMMGEHGVLYKAGFDPETAVQHRGFGSMLQEDGISSYAFLHKHIRHSGLSRMHYTDVRTSGYSSLSDLWINVRTLTEKAPSSRRFIWAYFDGIDTMSHHRHPDHEYPKAEFDTFIHSLQEYFIKPARLQENKTLLLFTADHGQIATPNNHNFDLSNHPRLLDMLHIFPTGENRLTYLHIRPGMVDAVRDYFSKAWGNSFILVNSQEALTQGLFGPGTPSPRTGERIGELTVISISENYLWWGDRPNPLHGRHGGLSADEMIVPLAGFIL